MNLYLKPKPGGCHCGSGMDYKNCCKPFHKGLKFPETAEQLMRARYCAYAKNNLSYIQETWHQSTLPHNLKLEPAIRWTGLEVLGHAAGMQSDLQGTVTFTAHYEKEGIKGSMTEISEFLKVSGRWYYYRAQNPVF